MQDETLTVDDLTINVKRKNIKNMYLRVKPPHGEIHISAPLYMSYENIEAFVKSKREWIKKQQNHIITNNIKAPLKYIDGEKHPLWGKEYTLKLIKNNNVIVDNENSILYLPKKSTIDKRQKELTEFYRHQVKTKLPEIFDRCVKIVGKTPKSIDVRKMKNWGNCKSDGRITLNLNLAKKDLICLEYVLIHELCHLIEFNHSKEFKKLMDRFCPNWREIKKILNEKD